MFHRRHEQDEQPPTVPQSPPAPPAPAAGQGLFHHHQDASLAEHGKLLNEGAKVDTSISKSEAVPGDTSRTRVAVVVIFKDGYRAEFVEEVVHLYQAAPDSPDAKRLTEVRAAGQVKHASKVPKIQLYVSAGERVPVVYDAASQRLALDQRAMQKKALDEWIANERRSQQRAQAQKAATVPTGPPWDVPTKCPVCGAPVDQAKASMEADPHCVFCKEPVPVTPRGHA